MLTLGDTERRTFSKRRQRSVRYSILVQFRGADGRVHRRDTGIKSKRFGVGPMDCQSEVCSLSKCYNVIVILWCRNDGLSE